ncbi:Putative cytochrome P450 132 [Peribacillus frigoritolerans]|uniref:cytochrome P450 n=1 Tax=Peribacillus frigoritolerans TaxID=450367 RepID=UPI001D961DAA|nr:cytochrome P450 [Peribacillus frigoritolerans]MED3888857.1 cytochrome P450 [Peribacillus frigoritolerans]CAH0191514.1 Putative cytochrome P450 132 [Peribacillus frigoritolerans]
MSHADDVFRTSQMVPKGRLVSGHTKEFQTDPIGFLTRLSKEYGEVAKFRLGPFQTVYHVLNPDLIKQILVTKQQSFVKSRDFNLLKPFIGEGLLTSEKDFHMRQRRLIQPSFKKTHIIQYAKDMIDVTMDYISTWQHDDERSITKDMMNITLGIISKTMFSMEFKDGYEIVGKPLETALRITVKRMRKIFRMPLWVPTKINREYKKAIQRLDKVIYGIIEKRKNDTVKHEDMLGILMDARDADDGLGMSSHQVRDELMTIFLAGHETTANALSWALYAISKHPEIQVKLFNEVNSIIGQRTPKPEDFMKLQYTQNIIHETLRFYPPLYILSRDVTEDVTIGRYRFKKGDMILISSYVMQHNPEYFDQPESFIPERFENNFMKSLPAFAYFPFGGGPRVCIGNHFAMMEAVFVLACIAKRYRIKLAPDHHEVTPLPSLTLRPKNGLRMELEERAAEAFEPGASNF